MKLLAISILFIKLFFTLASEDSLQLVQVIYRHGDRTPINFCKTDPYSNMKYWPEGLGQLTKKGMEMEYKLGGWLRRRYSNFISDVYKPEEIYVRSTDFDRTLMSANSVLGAFYYPASANIRFNKSIPWMPSAVHTTEIGKDKLIDVDGACPRISEEVKKVNEMPEILKFNEDHKELFDFLSAKCEDDRDSIRKVGFLYDTLFIEKSHNMTVPDWVDQYFDQMREVGAFSFLINTLTLELKRLRAGPLVEQFSRHMKKKAKGELEKKKMFMYSAHDSTVAIILHAMGAFNGIAPPYAATVLLELHTINKEHFVKMFYRNDTNIERDAYPIAIAGCSHVCPLSNWSAILSDVIPNDWEAECYIRNAEKDALIINFVTGILLGVTICLIIVGVLLRRKKIQMSSSQYKLLPST